MNYITHIGLEVHVELKTLSKMFCGCPADHFGKKPNTQTCPVCLGLPGALPVPNKKAIDWTIMIGLSLGCKINRHSKFDRKHYFYPDLPKGYQISQYDEPLCVNGKLTMDNGKLVRISRVHLEEDTGKLIHSTVEGKKVSLVDFNRSGVPLVEIVTEADLHSAESAKEFVKKIHRLVRSLGVSDCDMEKGSMRLEANVSLSTIPGLINKSRDQKLPSYKVEVKNLNSFRFLGRAIDYEIARQQKKLETGETPLQETRGWSETKNQTYSQRSKEAAQDYRYFPDPDIPPLEFSDEDIEKIRKKLPELPHQKELRFRQTYGLPASSVTALIKTQEKASFFEAAVKYGAKSGISGATIANAMINKPQMFKKPEELVDHLVLEKKEKVTDAEGLASMIDKVVKDNPQAVTDFKAGKPQVLGFLIGQIQKLAGGKADGKMVSNLLLERLASSR